MIAVGDRFVTTRSLRWTDRETDTKRDHTMTLAVTVTEVDATGFRYVVDEILAEADRPHFAGTPTGGSVAHFALPHYIDNGTWKAA